MADPNQEERPSESQAASTFIAHQQPASEEPDRSHSHDKTSTATQELSHTLAKVDINHNGTVIPVSDTQEASAVSPGIIKDPSQSKQAPTSHAYDELEKSLMLERAKYTSEITKLERAPHQDERMRRRLTHLRQNLRRLPKANCDMQNKTVEKTGDSV